MRALLDRLFKRKAPVPTSESLPTNLLRAGWTPHRFPNSDIVVVLPPNMTASFDADGVLYGFTEAAEPVVTATLHAGPEMRKKRALALEFVDHLAKKKGAQATDLGTYRYFFDPTPEREGSKVVTFCVIGIPGAVVVVSLTAAENTGPSAHLESIRNAVPRIIGELL